MTFCGHQGEGISLSLPPRTIRLWKLKGEPKRRREDSSLILSFVKGEWRECALGMEGRKEGRPQWEAIYRCAESLPARTLEGHVTQLIGVASVSAFKDKSRCLEKLC